MFVYFNHGITRILIDLIQRTKVECGGVCLTQSSCSAFYWDGTTCTILNRDRLYDDDLSDQVDVYVEEPNIKGYYIS